MLLSLRSADDEPPQWSNGEPRNVHDRRHVVDIETARHDLTRQLIEPERLSRRIRHEAEPAQRVVREDIAERYERVRGVVEGDEQRPSRSEHAPQLPQRLEDVGHLLEVVERGSRDDRVEGGVIEGKVADIRDPSLEEWVAVPRRLDDSRRDIDSRDTIGPVEQEPDETVADYLVEQVRLENVPASRG